MPYAVLPFCFRLSAHRFFIISDIRLRPAVLIPPLATRRLAAVCFGAAFFADAAFCAGVAFFCAAQRSL